MSHDISHAHAQPHGHTHDHADAPAAAPEGASVLMQGALVRVAVALGASVLLWAAVAWALMDLAA